MATLLVLASLGSAAELSAASLSGTVRNTAGAGLSAIEVTLWRDDGDKRWAVVFTTTTNSAGSYAFAAVQEGEYLLHARMSPGLTGNYADRWYDVDEPTADGYVGADADRIAILEDDALTGYDFELPIAGGLDGTVSSGRTPVAGMQVRVERAGEPRIHHNDQTDPSGPHWGHYYMRGLPPANDYRVLVHDPNGYLADAFVVGPLTVQSSNNGAVADIAMSSLGTDPYEPNNNAIATGAGSVSSGDLHADPPRSWSTQEAFIGPRGQDIDWYCFEAERGDRLLLTVLNAINLAGTDRESPWVDPILSLWTGDGAAMLMVDDDSGAGQFEPWLDTGPILQDGRLCAVVSMFGDTEWSGSGQMSAGAYTLEIDMGNRPPILNIWVRGGPAPEPPRTLMVAEGESLTFSLYYGDPDHDEFTAALQHLDVLGAEITDGSFETTEDGGTYSWSLGEQAATGSPYSLIVSVSDDEFTTQGGVVIEVESVNQPPSIPVQLAPENGGTERLENATLTVENSTDEDGDALTYEFELHYGEPSETPDQVGNVAEDVSGQTSWTTDPIANRSTASWRVRAYDGNAENAYSPWTDYWSFRVQTENAAPSAPVLIKPSNAEEVLDPTPTLSAQNSVDPDGDEVDLYFEVALDSDFTELVAESGAVRQSNLGSTTNWTVDIELEYAGTYYGRVIAHDMLGLTSGYSNVNNFSVRANQAPSVPELGEPFAAECSGVLFEDEPPDSVWVTAVVDAEGQDVSLQLQVFDFDDDPDASRPLIDTTVPQNTESDETQIEIDSGVFEAGGHYRIRVRAYDGWLYTVWSECDFFMDEEQVPAVELVIVSPEPGTVFPKITDEVTIEIQNAFDPQVLISDGLQVAYCASLDAEYSDCSPDTADWSAVQQTSMNPADTTTFTLTGIESGQQWFVQACALRPNGDCGPVDTTDFQILSTRAVITPGCACGVAASPDRLPIIGSLFVLVGVVLFWRRRG